MARIIENAVKTGYTVAWGGDVSEEGFTRDGLAYFYDNKAMESMAGSDTHSVARFLNLLLQQSSASSVSTTGSSPTTTVCLSTVSQRTSMARNTIW